MMNKTFMKELLTCISVSGREKAIQQIIYEYMKDVCEDSQMDASKTLISVLNAKAKQKYRTLTPSITTSSKRKM